MLLMVINALLGSALLVIAKLLMQWPYFRMMGASCVVASLFFAIGSALGKEALPDTRTLKWVVLRGLFSFAAFASLSCAVRVGASTGDVASLSSVNIIVAAVLGRIFLGEPLRRLHVIAMCCCITGAILISRPKFLFGGSGGGDAWIGYLLAVAGGFGHACVAISTRKGGNAPMSFFNCSTMFINGMGLVALPYTPLVDDGSLMPLVTSPLAATGWTGLIFFVALASTAAASGGFKWCPAAVSATVGTASRMVWGYLAESIIFGKQPDLLTVCGAAAMLVGVITMALARLPARQLKTAPAPPVELDLTDVQPEIQDSQSESIDAEDDDENESLASFIAAEFVDAAAHDVKPRQRRRGNSDMLAQRIGAVTSVMPCLA